MNAISAADSVLVPLQCEYYALEGLSQLLRTLKAVKKGLNPSLKLAHDIAIALQTTIDELFIFENDER